MRLLRTLQPVFLAATLSALPAVTSAQSAGNLAIGEIAPLSGPAATVGTRLNQVTKMWVDDVNRRGGINGRKIELTTCNDEARPEKAAACARDLIAKGIVLLFNNSLTASIRATQPLVANGPVMIVASPNITPPADSYVFQVSPSDFHLTKSVADFLKANRLSKIGMVAATDASGEVGVENARKVFAAEKIELKLARIDLRATDASNQLATVASEDIRVIFSSYSGAGGAVAVKSYHNLGLKQPLIVSYANLSAAFVNVVRDTLPPRLLGTSIAALVPDLVKDPGSRERSIAFAKAYQAIYGERPDMINYLGKLNVDTADAVLQNVKNPADVKAVKQFLESASIPSVHTIRFAKDRHVGLDESDLVIVELKNGTWVKAGPIE